MKKPIHKIQGKPIRRKAPQGMHFYSHIVETTEIILALGDMDLSKDERLHLVSLIESNLHHEILDLILSELNEEDKRIFLKHHHEGNHDKVWEHLSLKIKNIEDKIKNVAESLKKELYKDIQNTRRRK